MAHCKKVVPLMPFNMSEALARRLKISRERITPVLELLDAGFSPVFIAHYRKAETGSTDEETILRIQETRGELAAMEDLRFQARSLAERARALTERMAATIVKAEDEVALEDLMEPLRPKRRTAGIVACERGLEGLADYASAGAASGPDLAVKATEFVNPDREVRSPEEALAGAGHILAERVADHARVRSEVRQFVWERGVLKSQPSKQRTKQAAEFRGYFNFAEPLTRIPPHRILAINRGERSKALKVTIEVPLEALMGRVVGLVMPKEHRFGAFLKGVLADTLQRLVLPAVERDVRRRLTERSERHAADVFVSNLRSLLMARPSRGRRVLAIQPGYRTGCKMAVLEADGALLGETIVYPLEPQNKAAEAKVAILQAVQQHQVGTVAIGNGTGCREVEALVSELIEEHALDLRYAVVCEAGAAAYADSDLAKQEFGHLDAAIRAAISIGRRLQDPLAELVKIDPRTIGVGLYQHDVNQQRLQRALDETMESCVAVVGADANTASPSMLRRIPGLGEAQVAALVARRAEAPLASREQLKDLPGWDEKTFRMAAGFLRVRGDHPLDATRIQPELYAEAERLLTHLGYNLQDLQSGEKAQTLRKVLVDLSLEPLAEELKIPLPRLLDFVGALQRPSHDPRSTHHGPIFRRRMRRIEELQPGMWVKGTVRNVVDFGAFVDIGLKEEGLIHISQFSKRYVRNPLNFLHVGDVVDAKIVTIETDKHRIALTLIDDRPPRRREPRPKSRDAATGETPPARRPPADHARAPGAAAPSRGAPAAGARGRDAGGRTGRRPRDATPATGRGRSGPSRSDRRPRTGPPRVIISKSAAAPDERGPDTMGRPKIRWAHYDSDPVENDFDDFEDEVPQEPEPAAETADPDPAPEPQAEATEPATETPDQEPHDE